MTTETGQVPEPEEMADRLAIIDVIHTYSRGVDRASADILKSTCWPEAEVDYGGYKGPAHPFFDGLVQSIKRYANTQHQISNTIVDLDGDKAKAESYLTAHHYLPVEEGQDTEMTYIGRYFDRLEKRDNIWKFMHRQVVMTWHQNAFASADEEKNPGLKELTRASRHPEDPLFDFLDS